jgi:hypothetical protein
MKVAKILLGAALAAAAVPTATARAQTPPPVDGGTGIVGLVPSYLELILGTPTSSFASFGKARTYTSSFEAMVTATDKPTLLTLADGDATSGSRLGRLMSGSHRMPQPLEATVGKAPFQGLDASIDPLLATYRSAVSRKATTVRLRQKVRGKATGTYHKIILVTLSSQTP